jgi:vitamin K-dependent gamma-carboxylase
MINNGNIDRLLNEKVDITPLALFRIAFGFLIALEAIGAIFTGWVHKNLIDPDFTFSFIGFEWLQPLPGAGMYIYYSVMGIFGLFVMLGFYYRLSISLYTILWTGTYLMQKTSYNNHYYLLILICFLMMLVPAHRALSLDAKRKPEIKSQTIPRWSLLIFILQLWIVYTFAGLNKIYPDWLCCSPIDSWFQGKSDFWLIGGLLSHPWSACIVAYGGIIFDLLIVPLLLIKRTRMWAFGISIFFHLFNSAIFHIGIFPYMMIAMSVFFFPPESVRAFFLRNSIDSNVKEYAKGSLNKALLYLLAIYFVFQLWLPMRHWFYDSNVFWSEEGHRMAWRMMLRSKGGYVEFNVVNNKTGDKFLLFPDEHLASKQARRIAIRPDMIWQFVQYRFTLFHRLV